MIPVPTRHRRGSRLGSRLAARRRCHASARPVAGSGEDGRLRQPADRVGAIRCVLFDLDNTLFDHRRSLRRGVAAVRAGFPEALGGFPVARLEAAHERALEIAYRRRMRDGVPPADLARERTARFLDALGVTAPLDPAALGAAYETAYLADRRATEGSAELLGRLRAAGRRVAVVTDGARDVQRAKLEAIGLAALVDVLVTSEDAGAAKPDARIFALAAARCGGAPVDATMIGDDLARDVGGALAAGMAAIHYAPGAAPAGAEVVVDGRTVPAIGAMREAGALLALA